MNRRNLKWDDFVAGERYRVFKKPGHLFGVVYPHIAEIGICIWSDKNHGVNIRFADSKEKIIPINCLEEVDEMEKNEPKVNLDMPNIKIGNLYRIIKAPSFWSEVPQLYPDLNKIGKLIKVTTTSSKLSGVIEIGPKHQRFVPLSHLEEVRILIPPAPVVNLSDNILIDNILKNPQGFLKIIKGLAKMNKEPRLMAFLERGIV